MAFAFNPKTLRGRFCRGCAALLLAGASLPVLAGTEGVLLPPAPNGPGGEDSITTSQGVRCSQSVNSNSGYLDLGVTGGGGLAIGNGGVSMEPTTLGYARIVIPLGQQPKRLDCAQLYELEIERLKREIELLSIGLE